MTSPPAPIPCSSTTSPVSVRIVDGKIRDPSPTTPLSAAPAAVPISCTDVRPQQTSATGNIASSTTPGQHKSAAKESSVTSPCKASRDSNIGKRPKRIAPIPVVYSTKKPSRSGHPQRLRLVNSPCAAARRWQAEFAIHSPKSPLARVDVRAILLNPLTWSLLSAEDKAEIARTFPQSSSGSLQPPSVPGTATVVEDVAAATIPCEIDLDALRSDDTFRYDCARFTEALQSGRLDPEWLECAYRAHERSKNGEFRQYELDHFQNTWGVELKPDMVSKLTSEVEYEGEVPHI